jgi:hypothetical protein
MCDHLLCSLIFNCQSHIILPDMMDIYIMDMQDAHGARGVQF